MRTSAACSLLVFVLIGVMAPSAIANSHSKSLGAKAAALALAERGTRYRFGGANPRDGFDSSGLVQWVFGKSGHLQLPHAAFALKPLGRSVARDELRPGDLVFFDHDLNVGIYVGHGLFVYADHTGERVRLDSLRQSRFSRGYSGASRLT
jgi:cell wall-associated NlpC family hydrolase